MQRIARSVTGVIARAGGTKPIRGETQGGPGGAPGTSVDPARFPRRGWFFQRHPGTAQHRGFFSYSEGTGAAHPRRRSPAVDAHRHRRHRPPGRHRPVGPPRGRRRRHRADLSTGRGATSKVQKSLSIAKIHVYTERRLFGTDYFFARRSENPVAAVRVQSPK